MIYDLSKLKPYGIQSEKTTHRIHVDFDGCCLFIYKTENGVKALPDPIEPKEGDDFEKGGYKIVCPPWLKEKDKNLATARGIRLPYENIIGCRIVEFPYSVNTEEMTTSQKGQKAVDAVVYFFKEGMIPLHLNISEVLDKADQIKGKDIDLGDIVIQVKHDIACKKRGIFLQTHECNPYAMH